MTLNDILVSSLLQLDRGYDPQTLDVWRDKFTRFMNDAQDDLARTVKPKRTETVTIVNNTLSLVDLQRTCLRVVSVTAEGQPVDFLSGKNHGELTVLADGDVEVTYVYLPKHLSSPSDTPELPEECHLLIVMYVVARERMSGDASTQRGASAYLQMYQAQKSKLRPHYGEATAYKIKNRW